MLVKHSKEEMLGKDGKHNDSHLFWVSGKYEQHDLGKAPALDVDARNQATKKVPYSGIAEAVSELCYAIHLSSFFEEIYERVHSALKASELEDVVSVIPAVDILMRLEDEDEDEYNNTNSIEDDIEETMPTVASEHAFHRFASRFCRFMRAICTKEHPVVLFLDDLHWADDASSALLLSMSSDPLLHNLLVIATSRVRATCYLSAENSENPNVHVLDRCPLSEDDVNLLLAETMNVSARETKELATLVFQRAAGDLLFVTQFMELLQRRELLINCETTGRLTWNVTTIREQTQIVDDVIDLFLHKISGLSKHVQITLVAASILGYTFPVDVLAKLLQCSDLVRTIATSLEGSHMETKNKTTEHAPEEESLVTIDVSRCLKRATEQGLVELVSHDRYKFTHDRVQQSASSILPSSGMGGKVRGIIGEKLLVLSQTRESESWMFVAANLLVDHDSSVDNRAIAELCRRVAKRSANQAAFRSACSYADGGLDRLGFGGWSEHYDLTLDLACFSAEMHAASGDTELAMERIELIKQRVNRIEDKYRINCVLLDIHASLGGWHESVVIGRSILKEYGQDIPKRISKMGAAVTLLRTKRAIGGRTPKQLNEQLERVKDIRLEHVNLFLTTLSLYAFYAGETNLFVFLACQTLLTTLQRGICSHTCYAFYCFAGLLSFMGQFKLAYEYSILAFKGTHNLYMANRPKQLYIHYSVLLHLGAPISECLPGLADTYDCGIAAGDIISACRALQMRAGIACFVGMVLCDYKM